MAKQLTHANIADSVKNSAVSGGAKASPIVTTIPTAKETGNFELRTHANVVEIVKEDDKVTGVLYIDTLTQEEFFPAGRCCRCY